MFAQELSGEVFPHKDTGHVGEAAHPQGMFVEHTTDGRDNGCTAINGKHPERSCAGQFEIAPAQRFHCCKENLEAPTGETAAEKISGKLFYKWEHNSQSSLLIHVACESSF